MKTLEQLAREAGGAEFIPSTPYHGGEFVMSTADLSRFRAACRAEALEEAAQAVIKAQDKKIFSLTAREAVAAIREMKWCKRPKTS